MNVQEYTLVANTPLRIGIPGRLFILTDTGVQGIDVEFQGEGGRSARERAVNVVAGFESRPNNPNDPDDNFSGFILTSAVNQTVQVGTSNRNAGYNPRSTVQIQSPSAFTSTADVSTVDGTVTQVLAANANRLNAYVRNTSAANLRIGDSSITATRGQQLRPGETFVTSSTGAISVIRESATNVTVSLLEET